MTAQPTRSARTRTALRFLDRHRRIGAALCASAAVGAALSVLAPAPQATAGFLAAARELPAGHVLAAADVVSVELPRSSAPAGVLSAGTDVIGRAVPLPVRRGELLTDVRISGTALMRELTAGGLVGAPVRITDPAAAALLRAGDRIDVLGAAEGRTEASVIASNVLVVSVPARAEGITIEDGALLVVATTQATARLLAQAAVGSRLSVVLRG